MSDAEVESFAAAYWEVMLLHKSAQAELQQAQDQAQAQQLQAEIQQHLLGILERHDMTPQEYNAVIEQLNEDPALLARVQEELNSLAESTGGSAGAP